MTAAQVQPASVADRVDQLDEFEREPVTPEHYESGRHFAAVYAGEHVARTEFIIGALIACLLAVAVSFGLMFTGTLDAVFVAAPVWFLTGVLYLLLAALHGGPSQTSREESSAVPFAATSPSASKTSADRPAPHSRSKEMQPVAKGSSSRPPWLRGVGGLAAASLLMVLGLRLGVLFGNGDDALRLGHFPGLLTWISLVHLASVAL